MAVGQATDILIPQLPDYFYNTSVDDQITESTEVVTDFEREVGELISEYTGIAVDIDGYEPGEGLNLANPVNYIDYTAGSDLDYDTPIFQGEVPALSSISDISVPTAPEPFFSKPTIDVPAPPSVTFPDFDTPPPSISTPDYPNAPSVTLPDPPSIEEVVIPAPPDAVVPEFEGVAPSIDLTPPASQFAWSESAYTSQLMTAIKSRLETDVATGGSGLSATVEQAVYDRETARDIVENEQAYLTALEDSEERGWMLPTGQAMGQIIELGDMIAKKREELNDQIIKDQAALAQRNTHLAWTAAVKIEQTLLKHHSNVQRRSYEAARFALQAAIEIFKAKVEAYRAQTEAFGVLARVYEARIRAEIVKAELYKAHIEGLKTGIEANKLKVDVYKAQLEGINALVNLYRAEMEAGRIIAQIEKTRVLQYAAQVEAYKARISAIQARYDAYIAQVRGEELKADIVKADANAAKARANAYRAQAEAQLERARAAVERIRAQLIVYKAQIEKYAQQIRYNVGISRAEAMNDLETANLRVIQTKYDAASKDLQAANHNARTVVENGRNRAKAIASEAEQQVRTTVAEANAQGQRAAQEAATAIIVATNASDTTSSSKNHRQTVSQNKDQVDSTNSSASRTNTITVGYYDHYHSNA